MMARRGPSVVSLNTNPPPSPSPPSESPAAALSSVLCLPTDSHSFDTFVWYTVDTITIYLYIVWYYNLGVGVSIDSDTESIHTLTPRPPTWIFRNVEWIPPSSEPLLCSGFWLCTAEMRKANRAPSIIKNWKKQCQFEFSHAINTSASTILFVGSKRNENFMKMNTRKTFCGRSLFYENIKTVCDRKQQITVVYVDNATRVKKIQ